MFYKTKDGTQRENEEKNNKTVCLTVFHQGVQIISFHIFLQLMCIESQDFMQVVQSECLYFTRILCVIPFFFPSLFFAIFIYCNKRLFYSERFYSIALIVEFLIKNFMAAWLHWWPVDPIFPSQQCRFDKFSPYFLFYVVLGLNSRSLIERLRIIQLDRLDCIRRSNLTIGNLL